MDISIELLTVICTFFLVFGVILGGYLMHLMNEKAEEEHNFNKLFD